jgi:hypothetical protein
VKKSQSPKKGQVGAALLLIKPGLATDAVGLVLLIFVYLIQKLKPGRANP